MASKKTIKKVKAKVTGERSAPMEAQKLFAANLRLHRAKLGLSQLDLAEKCKISNEMVSLVESLARTPSIEMVSRIAKGLNVPIKSMFEEVKE